MLKLFHFKTGQFFYFDFKSINNIVNAAERKKKHSPPSSIGSWLNVGRLVLVSVIFGTKSLNLVIIRTLPGSRFNNSLHRVVKKFTQCCRILNTTLASSWTAVARSVWKLSPKFTRSVGIRFSSRENACVSISTLSTLKTPGNKGFMKALWLSVKQ